MDEKTPTAPANERVPAATDFPAERSPEAPSDGYLYDATLSQVDEVRGSLVFVIDGHTHRVSAAHVSSFTAGSIGRLRLPSIQTGFAFHIYADQRLRRAPELDDTPAHSWGWRINDRRFQVRAGLLPGRNGLVVPQDTRAVSLDLPREFLTYCETRRLAPTAVLRAFIGDLCEIDNLFAHPREDGYCSNGSDERRLAREYFQRAFGWTEDPAFRAKTRSARRGGHKSR